MGERYEKPRYWALYALIAAGERRTFILNSDENTDLEKLSDLLAQVKDTSIAKIQPKSPPFSFVKNKQTNKKTFQFHSIPTVTLVGPCALGKLILSSVPGGGPPWLHPFSRSHAPCHMS